MLCPRSLISAFFAALVLVGCSHPCEVGQLGTGLDCPSRVDAVEASPEYLAACGEGSVEQAASYWNLPVGEGAHPAFIEYRAPADPSYEAETFYELDYRRGRMREIRGATVVTTSCDPLVLAHELGHALGYPDTDEHGTIMCYSVDCAGRPQQALQAEPRGSLDVIEIWVEPGSGWEIREWEPDEAFWELYFGSGPKPLADVELEQPSHDSSDADAGASAEQVAP